jgi:exosortase
MSTAETRPTTYRPWLLPAAVAVALVWSYWTTLAGLVQTWRTDAQYSHGFLVPAFALFLLWNRRGRWADVAVRPTWLGLPLLLVAAALRITGGYYYSPFAEQISLLPALAGICLCLGGWQVLRFAAPAIAFLVFMVPLPGRIDTLLAHPLQLISTQASTNILQTLGFFAQSEQNVIVLKDYELGIVEACSGLRMLMVFVAAAVGVACVVQRSPLQRALIVLSAVPIAVFCNVVRITTTGVVHETLGHEIANRFYHDFAGVLMPLLAVACLGLELAMLGRLFVPVERDRPVTVRPTRPAMTA